MCKVDFDLMAIIYYWDIVSGILFSIMEHLLVFNKKITCAG